MTLETQEGSAHGAALLAMVGTGEFATLAKGCKTVVREVEVREPGVDRARYQALGGLVEDEGLGPCPTLRD